MTPVVASFPCLAALSANPYWVLLDNGLRERGWTVDDEADARFGAHWLRENRYRVDVLHFHYVQRQYAYEHTHARLRWALRFARNLLLARLWGYRIVFTLHNLVPSYPLEPRWVDALGHRIVVAFSHAVIVHCEAAREALRRRFWRRRDVFAVQHPSFVGYYSMKISRTEARQRLGIDGRANVYLFLGGLRPNKGLTALCDAFAGLQDPDAVLLIVGSPGEGGPHINALLDAARADSRVRVMAEYVPDDEVQLYMNACDIVVLPFAEVLTSSSAILALSFGKPVIVPRMGCMRELVTEEVGFLYDPGDPQGLHHAMQEARNRDLNEMGRKAADLAAPLTVERFIEETLVAYGVTE